MLERAGGVRYAVRWYDASGRMRQEAAGSVRGRAEERRGLKEQALNAAGGDGAQGVPWREAVTDLMAQRAARLAPQTAREEATTVRLFEKLAGVDAAAWLHEVSGGHAERFVAARLAGVGPKLEHRVGVRTARKDCRVLGAIFSEAERMGWRLGRDGNPWPEALRRLRRVREPERDLRVLTVPEIARLMAACETVLWKTLVLTALTTGMRRREMEWLRWEDVDFDGMAVRVRSSDEHRTKSGKGRLQPMTAGTAALLDRLRGQRLSAEWVFPNERGGRRANNLLTCFKRRVRRAKIADCTLHDLRRTYISHLQMAGAAVAVAQALAGHASSATTEQYYTRVLPDAAVRAVAALPWARYGATGIRAAS